MEQVTKAYPNLKMESPKNQLILRDNSGDRNKVIELANQIVLPPIREQLDSQ